MSDNDAGNKNNSFISSVDEKLTIKSSIINEKEVIRIIVLICRVSNKD